MNLGPVNVQGSQTSYFSAPEQTLDPTLFSEREMRGWVRNGILQLLFGFLSETYRQPQSWANVWVAGSAVSYQWSAAREPGDLDVLVGVDYVVFKKLHPEYQGLTEKEISSMLNEEFRTELQPDTKDWNGFEVTFYVNPGATDIRSIQPYAAYDLVRNEWTVAPSQSGAPHNAVWELMAQKDKDKTEDIVKRYSKALTSVQAAQNDPARRNAESQLHQALMQASLLYEDIHHGRRFAFSQSGKGYSDFYNYRWQAGKKYGTIPALKKMSEYWSAYKTQQAQDTYGVELPDTQTLIRRAAMYRAKG